MTKITDEVNKWNKESWDRIQAAKKKPARLILSTSFTIDQVRDFLDLIAILNKNQDPGKIMARPNIGILRMKFENLKLKYQKNQGRGSFRAGAGRPKRKRG